MPGHKRRQTLARLRNLRIRGIDYYNDIRKPRDKLLTFQEGVSSVTKGQNLEREVADQDAPIKTYESPICSLRAFQLHAARTCSAKQASGKPMVSWIYRSENHTLYLSPKTLYHPSITQSYTASASKALYSNHTQMADAA